MSKVLFLDFDGVIMTTRSKYASPTYDGKALDRVATDFLANLCATDDIKIVVISNWRREPISCREKLAEAGLEPYLHEDWMVEWYDPSALIAPAVPRGQEIANWLLRHTDTESYRIADDESQLYTMADQIDRLVVCNSDDGLGNLGMAKLLNWGDPKWIRKTKKTPLP